MREVEVLAPAKINLFLGVIGRRKDGYHDIVSVMQKLDLADRLHLCLTGERISLRCPKSGLDEDAGNLAWRAADLFYEQVGIAPGVRITLKKRIPVAAGLGGGSSDAAAVLLGLNWLHDALLPEEALLSLGGRLGADVPFFLGRPSVSLVTGTGTELWPMAAPQKAYSVLLVNPGVKVATSWVYNNLGLTAEGNPYMLRGYSYWADHARAVLGGMLDKGTTAGLYNDLEQVTIRCHPVIRTIKEQLLAAGASASLMSGSGSTVFGIFSEADLAENARAEFLGLYPEVYLTHPLP